MSVLVVEDEALLLMALCDELEGAGLAVAAAGTAEAALALLDAGAVAPPAVLVTDLNLGPGMDGVALAADVRRRRPGVAVLYATGNPDRVAARPGALGPRDRVFAKPFDPADLAAAAVRAAGAAVAARGEATGGKATGGKATGGKAASGEAAGG